MAKASEVARLLDLKPNPEGGFYKETFRDSSVVLSKSHLPQRYKVDRPISTSIFFLLTSGSVSHLHRIPCAETWNFYKGEPLTVSIFNHICLSLICAETWHFYKGEPLTVLELYEDGKIKLTVLGLDLGAGQRPQYTVPPNVWFGSFPTMDVKSYSSDGSSLVQNESRDSESHYSLVGCTCAPAFQFEDFELGKRDSLIPLAPKAEDFITYLTFPDS